MFSFVCFAVCLLVAYSQQVMMVPAYFDSTKLWSQMKSLPKKSYAILNPDDGPGEYVDPSYLQNVKNIQTAGSYVIGYVYTSYGNRAIADVEAEISKYITSWGVTGIFFDECAEDSSKLSYYQTLSKYVYSKNSTYTVTLNPGIFPDQGYFSIANIIVVFEDSYKAYTTTYKAPSYASSINSKQMCHMVLNTDGDDLSEVEDLSVQRRAGLVYITDDYFPNPYNTLPSYYNTEVCSVQGTC